MNIQEEMMNRLIDDDMDTIENSGGGEYLYNILRYGIRGYGDYSAEELQQELLDRGIEI